MKKPRKSPVISKITKAIVPTTAIASGLLSPPLFGAPGDLDPAFGDMGRVGAGFVEGPAWSVQALAGNKSLIAGGQIAGFDRMEGCDYYSCHAEGFFDQFSAAGSLWSPFEAELVAPQLSNIEVYDFALQADGKVVAVGRRFSSAGSQLTVFRLLPGGALDPDFASLGVMEEYPADSIGQSVIIDPGGAIVIGGSKGGSVMVLRLLANGSVDGSFGSDGVYLGPKLVDVGNWRSPDPPQTRLLRTASGEYRVSFDLLPLDPTQPSHCAVLALTATGKLNTGFGTAGIAAPSAPSDASIHCPTMAGQSDGGLVLAGQEGDQAFVGRLLASGAPDPTFDASAVQANMTAVTAIAVDAADSILVAGPPSPGVSGAVIMRLHASGLLDELFGDHGSTWVDLLSSAAANPILYNIRALPDGHILAAGGELSTQTFKEQPLLVRLVGMNDAAGPGVIGTMQSTVAVKSQDRSAVVTVRRMGGATGSVSVSYQTAGYTAGDAPPAVSGVDYTPVTGQLTWADGDRSDRQITIPVLTNSRVEEPKRFSVTLDGATGGAKFGTQQSAVEVATDGDRAGELGFTQPVITAYAADGKVQIVVNRNYYFTGPISVTVTPHPASATSADFSAAPVTLSWADGDGGSQTATIPIVRANIGSTKSFTVDLTNPTNGAVLGRQAHEAVTINPGSAPPPGGSVSSPSGGGGTFDWLSLLGLACVRWLRRRAFAARTIDNST
jgi:uncharacterized delta-60 repeat protein